MAHSARIDGSHSDPTRPSGSARTALAAERLKRRWICGDVARAYLRGAAFHLDDLPGYTAA